MWYGLGVQLKSVLNLTALIPPTEVFRNSGTINYGKYKDFSGESDNDHNKVKGKKPHFFSLP